MSETEDSKPKRGAGPWTVTGWELAVTLAVLAVIGLIGMVVLE